MQFSGVRFSGPVLAAMVALSACASSAPQQPTVPGGMAPQMTIERFLRAANQNDLDTMASLFGTRDGSIARTWSRREIDDRMLLLSSLLRHTDYTILAEQIVPGRREEATLFEVRLALAQGQAQVPFTMVRSRNNEWLVEQIGIERITHPNRNRP